MEAATAALFPGIGAQRVGMGKKLYDIFAVYRETLTEASDEAGEDFATLLFDEANKERLGRQEQAQLGTFVTSVAMYRTYAAESGMSFGHYAGHSLGEISALCAAGALDFPSALTLVRRRAEIIREVAGTLGGTMMWVINLDAEYVTRVCRRLSGRGADLSVSAVDAPRQVAISGETALVGRAAGILEARGGMVYPLRMEGPYHSPMMRPAAERMAEVLADVDIAVPRATVLSTVTGEAHPGGAGSRALLADQLVSPVRWLTVQRALAAHHVRVAVEFGPGTVLSFLLEKSTDSIRPWPVQRYDTPSALKDAMTLGADDFPGVVRRCLVVAAATPCRTQPSAADRERMDAAYAALQELDGRAGDGAPTGRAEVADALARTGGLLEAKGWHGAAKDGRLQGALDGRLLPVP
ncbi:ACP S-malonyltransferase [Streptomyces niveus]|uniref:ACP S-malonyltransferase n=1 Tax=Streptomyces niveus TaxID=193462 RepID=UPI0033E1988E